MYGYGFGNNREPYVNERPETIDKFVVTTSRASLAIGMNITQNYDNALELRRIETERSSDSIDRFFQRSNEHLQTDRLNNPFGNRSAVLFKKRFAFRFHNLPSDEIVQTSGK